MKRALSIALFAAALLSPPWAAAQSPAPASKPAAAEMDMDKHMAQMQENMTRMKQQMDKIRQTKDPKERQQLMQEHMQTMQEHMRMMRGMGGGMMMGMMGGQQGGGMGPGTMSGSPGKMGPGGNVTDTRLQGDGRTVVHQAHAQRR